MKKLLVLACMVAAFVATGSEWKSAIDAIVNDANLPAKEKIAVLRATAEGAGDARGEFVGAIRELAAETGDAGAWAWCDAVDAQKPAPPRGKRCPSGAARVACWPRARSAARRASPWRCAARSSTRR